MGGTGLQTGLEKGKGCELTNYNYKNPNGYSGRKVRGQGGVMLGSVDKGC